MANDDDTLCLGCDHLKSEHGDKGCTHLDARPSQPHGNPEAQACSCEKFRPRLYKGFQVK